VDHILVVVVQPVVAGTQVVDMEVLYTQVLGVVGRLPPVVGMAVLHIPVLVDMLLPLLVPVVLVVAVLVMLAVVAVFVVVLVVVVETSVVEGWEVEVAVVAPQLARWVSVLLGLLRRRVVVLLQLGVVVLLLLVELLVLQLQEPQEQVVLVEVV
jgi:hypothetical protein